MTFLNKRLLRSAPKAWIMKFLIGGHLTVYLVSIVFPILLSYHHQCDGIQIKRVECWSGHCGAVQSWGDDEEDDGSDDSWSDLQIEERGSKGGKGKRRS